MPHFAKSVCWLSCLLMLMAIGCKKSATNDTSKASPDSSAETGGSAEDGTASAARKKLIPVRKGVTTLDGNWVMIVTTQGRDNFLWIVRLTSDASGRFQGEIIDASNDELKPTLLETVVEEKTVRLVVKNERATVNFRGSFDGVVTIRGTLANGPQEMYLARMLPTDESSLAKYSPTGLPPAADVFRNAIASMQQKPEPKVILQLAREHKTSPVALESLSGLLMMQTQMPMEDAFVREIVDEYISVSRLWGQRMAAQAEFAAAQNLIVARRMPDESLKHLDESEKLLTDDLASLKPRIQMFREEAEIQISLAKMQSKSDDDRKAAYAELQEALKKQTFNVVILLALAEHAAATKQLDAAIEYYSDVVALPLLEQLALGRRTGQPAGDPTPTDVLKKLWIERHGSDESLQAHLADVHRRRLDGLLKEICAKAPAVPPADAGDHVVLVELFTGGQMPPSVATEIAVDALGQTMPRTEVIALRYHQHVPGPDGLVNQDGEDRFAFYELGRTPTIAIDGLVINPDQVPYSGYLQFSDSAFNVLRQFVDQRLQKSTPIRVELSASVTNGELSIQAAVTGATEEQLPSLRLRLALAEDLVDAPMPNGIRRHEMVVREMPGGAKGISAKRGELKYSLTIPLAEVQKHLEEYLSGYEAGKKITIPESAKPPLRGPLSLVGWVQNDKIDEAHPEMGRQILQASIIPIPDSVMAVEPTATPAASAPKSPPVPARADSTPPPPALPE